MSKYLDRSFDWSKTNFTAKEFVPKEIWDVYKEGSVQFISKFQVDVAMLVRQCTQKFTYVNTWHINKNGHNYRGFRPRNCKVGAKFSLHKTSDALDFNVQGMSTKAVHRLIMANHDLFWNIGVRRLEDPAFTTTWVHVDNKNSPGQTKIIVFKP